MQARPRPAFRHPLPALANSLAFAQGPLLRLTESTAFNRFSALLIALNFALSIAQSELLPAPGTDLAVNFEQADTAFTLVRQVAARAAARLRSPLLAARPPTNPPRPASSFKFSLAHPPQGAGPLPHPGPAPRRPVRHGVFRNRNGAVQRARLALLRAAAPYRALAPCNAVTGAARGRAAE